MVRPIKSKDDLAGFTAKIKEAQRRKKAAVRVCAGTGCVANGSLEIYDQFAKILEEKGLKVDLDLLLEEKEPGGVTVEKSGCHGFCQRAAGLHRARRHSLYKGKSRRCGGNCRVNNY